jgi:trk system potassium uptake protein TrkA
VRIFVIGAGQVGSTIVEALHDEHHLTVMDLDTARLDAVADRFDSDLLIACTSRDEVNLIAAIFAKRLSAQTRTVVRTNNVEYLEVWREREVDIDFMVSSELETAHAVSRIIGLPAARQTDVFADGQVQIVEFDVESDVHAPDFVGLPLRTARIPADSKVAAIIRGDGLVVPRGDASIEVGDRIVVIGSPRAAREWSESLAREHERVDDVVVYGGEDIATAIARLLLEQQIRVRIIEADPVRARAVAQLLPDARVFNASGHDPEFLERERIGRARAAVFAMRDDAKNHYAAALAKLHGVGFAIAVVHEAISIEVFERAGIDVAIDPRAVTAEEIVRFAHDPRTQQVTMLEGDRYEILDVTVRPESELLNRPFRELPVEGALIGAIIRDGTAIFPHGDDALLPGDRVIVFTEAARATAIEREL